MKITILLVANLFCVLAHAQIGLTSNSYSGLGIIPSSESIRTGEIILDYTKNLPAAKNAYGYNYQIGIGLFDGFELVGRLATNDLKCNMYQADTCAKNNIRDFSTSIKYSFETELSKKYGLKFAVGATDFGGAAINFRSYYALASKKIDDFQINMGYAKSDINILKRHFESIDWYPRKNIGLSLQHSNGNINAAIAYEEKITKDISGYIAFNKIIRGDESRNHYEFGIKLPLGNEESQDKIKDEFTSINFEAKEEEVIQYLKKAGFNKISIYKNKYKLENTNYSWDSLDALGVALGIITSVKSNNLVELIITKKDTPILTINGETNCIKKWMQNGEYCDNLEIKSGLSIAIDNLEWIKIQNDFKPEITFSPAIVSTIGTEFGAFDADVGANIAVSIPLWQGANLEKNEIRSLGVNTNNFEAGQLFHLSRIINLTNRKLFNQLIHFPEFSTVLKLSMGQIYNNWNGQQYEQYTLLNQRNIFGIQAGDFQNAAVRRNYSLITYKNKNNKYTDNQTEVTLGKFWNGDKGYNIAQKFWFGDRALSIYLRRTRKDDFSPLISFAGIQFTLPLTTRFNKTENLLIKGAEQWSYSVESKIFAKDNIITNGYGTIPFLGDSLGTILNRDRNSNIYYENNINRVREAFIKYVEMTK